MSLSIHFMKLICVFLIALTLPSSTVEILADDLDSCTIRGIVSDSSGAVIANAHVKIIDAQRGRTESRQTDSFGVFTFSNLRPAEYVVEATADGFKKYVQPRLALLSGQTEDLRVLLQIASLQQSVVVVDEAPAIDISKTVVGGFLTSRDIDLLPLNGREILDLILLFPGVTEQPFDTRDAADTRSGGFLEDTPIEAGNFSLSGGRSFSNNLTVDGFDNNDDREARERISYSRESVQEVQVVTHQFSAEYGRASGGRVNLVTRSGGNKIHGRGYFFFQDESLNANSFFRNMVGEPRVPYQTRQTGAFLSGPLKRDKIFFFASYERDDYADSTAINIPLPLTTNSRYPLPQPNSQIGIVLYQPSKGTPVIGGRWIEEVDTPGRRNFTAGKMDWLVNARHNVSIRYDTSRGSSLTAFSGGARFPSTAVAKGRDSQSWGGTENFVIGRRWMNQLRYQYSRLIPSNLEQSADQPVAIVVNGSAGFSAGGSASTFTSNRRGQRAELRHQFSDNLIFTGNRRTWKWGSDVQRVRSHELDLFEVNGIYTFSNVADFLNNDPSRFQQAVGNPEGGVANDVLGFYVQQDWRIRPNLSLNFGLRYDVETVLGHDNNNWGPRGSLAWAPFHSDRTLLRAGFGIFYNRVLLRSFGDFAGKTGLRFVDLRTGEDVLKLFPGLSAADANQFLSALFPRILPNSADVYGAATPPEDTRRIAPNLRISYSEQASLGVEREIRRGMVVEASYQFNRGVKLWRDHNINAP
ncbi:MAG: TonB-dependent receptor, partial [Acidobacteriia bacterium]|nr:TonB-dependent receptor [Terriglobia bacterium]